MEEIKSFFGKECLEHIDDVARMRMKYFREFPYLYDGRIENEMAYLREFSAEPRSMIVTVHENGLQAISTATPLPASFKSSPESAAAFRSSGRNPEEYFYYGEIIIAPPYRSRGLARKICAMQEAWAVRSGFSKVCLAVVIRENNHPLKPEGYVDIAVVCRALGFEKTDIVIDYRWPTVHADGTAGDEINKMVFWEKNAAAVGK